MSGTFPTSVGFSSIDVIHDQPEFVDIAGSGKRQSRISAGHLWKIKASFPPMIRSEFSPIYGFSIKQRGSSFQITLPHLDTPQGVATGTPLTTSAHSAGDNTITTDGWTISQAGIMKAGDILKYSSHTKVYMMVEDADSDGSGLSTLMIDPPLIQDIANNEALTVNGVPFTVAFNNDGIHEYKTTSPEISSFSIDLTEAL